MSDPRVIKKYPNRRLYDTVESRYITLADVRRLVVEKIDFIVVDKKNNADITRSILLQVIAEQEQLSDPLLSEEFMIDVIRSYGSPMHAAISTQLVETMRTYHGTGRDRPKAIQVPEPVRTRPPEEGFKPAPLRETTFVK